MELTFQVVHQFEKELKAFPQNEQDRIISKLNLYCNQLLQDPAGFYRHAARPIVPILKSKMESSLYSIRVTTDIRVLATIDDDPLFDQYIVTLLSVVRRKNLEKSYRRLAKSIYQSDLSSFKTTEGGNHGGD